MASEIRVNSLSSRTGLSTVTFTDTGPIFSGITTFQDNSGFNVGTGGSIFSPASNTVTLGTNNAERLRIQSDGDVGIGTDNPGAKTHIDSVTSNTPLVVEASQNNRSRIVFRNNVETGTECNVELIDDDLRFVTNSGERLRITSNGKVGIDSTTPHRQLVVGDGGDISCFGTNGGIYFGTSTGGFRNNGAIARAQQAGYHVSGSQVGDLVMATEADKALIFSSGGSSTMYERLRLTTDGKIGIGDQSPENTLSCLLYTSPSPRDYAASRMPSSA